VQGGKEGGRVLGGSRALEEVPDVLPSRELALRHPAHERGLLLHALAQAVDAGHAEQRRVGAGVLGGGRQRLERRGCSKANPAHSALRIADQVRGDQGDDRGEAPWSRMNPISLRSRTASPGRNRRRASALRGRRAQETTARGRRGTRRHRRPARGRSSGRAKKELEGVAGAPDGQLHPLAPILPAPRADVPCERKHGARRGRGLARPASSLSTSPVSPRHPLREKDALGPRGRVDRPPGASSPRGVPPDRKSPLKRRARNQAWAVSSVSPRRWTRGARRSCPNIPGWRSG
jgi:hypothetical protein